MVAASVMAGIADGVVQSHWAPMAARALAATLAALDGSVALTVSPGTPVGGSSIYLPEEPVWAQKRLHRWHLILHPYDG